MTESPTILAKGANTMPITTEYEYVRHPSMNDTLLQIEFCHRDIYGRLGTTSVPYADINPLVIRGVRALVEDHENQKLSASYWASEQADMQHDRDRWIGRCYIAWVVCLALTIALVIGWGLSA